jgi:transcriptional regulator with XRE-family HTH domain
MDATIQMDEKVYMGKSGTHPRLYIAEHIAAINARGGNLNQRKLAELTGFGESFLSQLVSGERNASTATLEKLATALGTEVPFLYYPPLKTDLAIQIAKLTDHERRMAERFIRSLKDEE